MKRKSGFTVLALLLAAQCMTGFVGCGEKEEKKQETEAETFLESDGESQETTAEKETEESKEEVAEVEVRPLAAVAIEPIENLPEDFIFGADVSSYEALIQSGAVFYDFDGNMLDEQGFFDLLAAGGTNYIRLRVWNDPYDENGNGYGGGNNDLEAAKNMGLLATKAGMRVLIDFHYSDFWADPAKQQSPKEWENMSLEEKAQALSDYTKESLKELLDAGVDVGMIQLGNETTSGMAGEDYNDMYLLMKAGAEAVREVNPDIMIAVHFTNPERANAYATFSAGLENAGVDYDVFASSYYPYWHGTLENLTNELSMVAETYHKKVMVVETSWAYTTEDGDGSGNTIGEDTKGVIQDYVYSEQGQCRELACVTQAVVDVKDAGIGVFYWEPAWIPVQYAYDGNGNQIASVVAHNKEAWENYGSGWASSYAGSYDAEDAGKYYGGSAVDNQAWFDFTGHPLATLNIFRYLKEGVTCENPESGYVKDSSEMADTEDANEGNYLVNPGFEDDLNGWEISDGEIMNNFDASSNAHNGSGSLHFYTDTAGVSVTASQKVVLPKGTYQAGVFLEGGDAGADDLFEMIITVGDTEYRVASSVSSWQVWENPTLEGIEILNDDTEVTVTLSISQLTKGVWGAFDDAYLTLVE